MHKKSRFCIKETAFFHVIPIGFEPMTYRLEICCSIQLSYRTIANYCGAKVINMVKMYSVEFYFFISALIMGIKVPKKEVLLGVV